MAETVKYHKMTIASAATGSNEVAVFNSRSVALVIEDNSAWNAGAGNATVQIWGSYASGATHMPITPVASLLSHASITTSGDGVYPMTLLSGIPYLSVHVSTATTSTGIFYIVTANDS